MYETAQTSLAAPRRERQDVNRKSKLDCRNAAIEKRVGRTRQDLCLPETMLFDASSRALLSTAKPGKIRTTPAVEIAE